VSGQSLEEIYDSETLRAIDGWSAGGRTVEPMSRWRRGVAAGALTSALVTGVRDALEDEPEDSREEIDLRPQRTRLEPVTFYYVPGEPPASVAVVRPWLL
jgi:hypothetical protein